MIKSNSFLIFLVASVCLVHARVPPRTHEIEESTVERTKVVADESPVQRSPVDTVPDDATSQERPFNRKPMVILFRQQPAFSLFSNRSPNPFHSIAPDHDHPHFPHFHSGNPNDDPAVRLISLLFGGRRPSIRNPEPAADGESTNVSTESSVAESADDGRKEIEPIDSLFPHIFPFPRFPLDDSSAEKDGEASTSSEDKTPANFENKEKKVITIGGRKFVKTVQTKKVKNDFGQFHSVISSYQPFDEKIHDENGNEKVKPDENAGEDNKEKKDVESSTAASEKVDSSSTAPSSDSSSPATESASTLMPEREESTSKSPELTYSTVKEAEKLKLPTSESLSNEIPDKSSEIKVDQMN